jgi:hypothetical protein
MNAALLMTGGRRTPDQVGTLWAWYKRGEGLYTDAGVTPAVSHDDLIYQWSDASGNGNHATRTGSGSRPALDTSTTYLGVPSLRFKGPTREDYLNVPALSALTSGEVFVVVQIATDPPASSGHTGLWSFGRGGTLASQTRFPDTDGAIKEHFGLQGQVNCGNPATPLTQWNVWHVRAAVGDWAARLNDTVLATDTPANVYFDEPLPRLGGSDAGFWKLDGWIAELLIYDGTLSDSERAAVYSYLTT